jgi:hypothetical protein
MVTVTGTFLQRVTANMPNGCVLHK